MEIDAKPPNIEEENGQVASLAPELRDFRSTARTSKVVEDWRRDAAAEHPRQHLALFLLGRGFATVIVTQVSASDVEAATPGRSKPLGSAAKEMPMAKRSGLLAGRKQVNGGGSALAAAPRISQVLRR